jgi:Secretion system C-terminal sorting domain
MKKIIYILLCITFAQNLTYAQCSPIWPNSLTTSASAAPVGSTVTLTPLYTTFPPFNTNHYYRWVDITAGGNCGSSTAFFGQQSVGVAFQETSPPLVAGNNIFTLRFDCSTGVQCNPTLQVVVVGIDPLNINENNPDNNFKIYPNPASDYFTIEMENELKSVEIYSIHGQKVLTSNSKSINVSDLSKGIYFVRIEDQNSAVSTQKLIIK